MKLPTKKISETKKYEKLGRQLEHIFEGGYLNHVRVYRINFLRGLFFGLGAALGGTLLIAIVVWLLSLFSEIPLIGRFAETVRETIQAAN